MNMEFYASLWGGEGEMKILWENFAFKFCALFVGEREKML